MDAVAWVLIIGGIILVIVVISRTKINEDYDGTNTNQISVPNVPDGYEYRYTNGGTGYALNIDTQQIYLKKFGFGKIYSRDDIRNIEYKIIDADQIDLFGPASIRTRIGVGLKNKAARQDARDSTGIFIHVKDIAHPIWQIAFDSSSSIHRSFEILSQFLDGDLEKEIKKGRGH